MLRSNHCEVCMASCCVPGSGGSVRLSVIGGLDYWNGLLEWTTEMDFDLFFFPPQELTIHIEELV